MFRQRVFTQCCAGLLADLTLFVEKDCLMNNAPNFLGVLNEPEFFAMF
jgi:hypothetical protein